MRFGCFFFWWCSIVRVGRGIFGFFLDFFFIVSFFCWFRINFYNIFFWNFFLIFRFCRGNFDCRFGGCVFWNVFFFCIRFIIFYVDWRWSLFGFSRIYIIVGWWYFFLKCFINKFFKSVTNFVFFCLVICFRIRVDFRFIYFWNYFSLGFWSFWRFCIRWFFIW